MSSYTNFDIIIVGAGIIGLTLANALTQKGFRLAVIDAQSPPASGKSLLNTYDLRVSAITHTSERIFRSLHCWKAIENLRISPYYQMDVWDTTGSAAIHFDQTLIQSETLGHIIENRILQAVLWERLQDCDDITFFCPMRLASCAQQPNTVQLQSQEGHLLETSLLIGADGIHSWVREQIGMDT